MTQIQDNCSPQKDARSGAAWAIVDVFVTRADAHRYCCDCCGLDCPSGYPEHRRPEVLLRAGGYLSDRYVMITEERLCDAPVTVQFDLASMPASFQVPEVAPPPSEAFFVPSRAAKLLDLGLTIHQGEGTASPQHVYDGEVHVGWIMGAKAGAFTLTQVRSAMALLTEIRPGSPLYTAIDHPQMPLIDGLALVRAAVPVLGELSAKTASTSAVSYVEEALGLSQTGSRG